MWNDTTLSASASEVGSVGLTDEQVDMIHKGAGYYYGSTRQVLACAYRSVTLEEPGTRSHSNSPLTFCITIEKSYSIHKTAHFSSNFSKFLKVSQSFSKNF